MRNPSKKQTNKQTDRHTKVIAISRFSRDNDKELDKELAKNLRSPCSFNDENLKISFKINLERHNIYHAISILTIVPKFPEFGIEFRYIIKVIKKCLLFMLD